VDRDVIVVGGGPVALAMACAAARALRGMSVAIVAHERRAVRAEPPLDARVYALSPGNVAFLRTLGVWSAVPAARTAPVHAMQVHGDRGARLEFDAYRAGVPELAWIVEDGLLRDALWNAVGAEVYAPVECRTLRIEPEQAVLAFADGRSLTARLVIGADGANSFVRREAGIACTESEYGQHAVVGNFECERPHGNTAYQWFLPGGAVLALLPLPGRRVSMVWSLSNPDHLSDTNLAAHVQAACDDALGAMTLITPSRRYPLRRRSAQRLVAPRIALAGDAAHVVHPLAGQGLNLGLQDVRALAEVLATGEPMRDLGDVRLLRRYERGRAEPILAMDAVIGGLFALFGIQGRAASFVRNAGLNLTDRMQVLKNILMRQAMH
jgi:ubiquinone biosynthesis UbiH/UbiF/VisC/COQ6 family hydroxylase